MSRLVTLFSLFLTTAIVAAPVCGQESSSKKLIHLVAQKASASVADTNVKQAAAIVSHSATLERSILDDSVAAIPKLNKAGTPVSVAAPKKEHALTSLQVSERKSYPELDPVVPNSLRATVESTPAPQAVFERQESDVKQASATPVSFETKVDKVETTNKSALLADTALVVVRPPFVQPYYPTQYTFMVQNVGALTAENVMLTLVAPQDVVINNVRPAPIRQSGNNAVEIVLESIEGGQAMLVEVDVQANASEELINFEASVTQTAKQAFSRAAFSTPSQNEQAPPEKTAQSSQKVKMSLASTTTTSPTHLPAMVQSPKTEVTKPRISSMPNAVGSTVAKQEVATSLVPLEPVAENQKTVSLDWQERERQLMNLKASQVSTAQDTDEDLAKFSPINEPVHSNHVTRRPVAEERVERPAQEAVQETVVQTVAAPIGYALNTQMHAPSEVVRGQESEYAIEVQNQSSADATDILVQLTLSEGLEVTVLDRSAWYDRENRKISWQQASLASGQTETIRYKAIASKMGEKSQSVTVGMQGLYQGQATSRTSVSSDSTALIELPAGSIK